MFLIQDKALSLLIPPDVPDGLQPQAGRELHHQGEVFGTTWSLTLVRREQTDARNDEAYLAQLVNACRQTLALIDRQMSLWQKSSTINQYNAFGAGERLALPEPMTLVVAKAFAAFEQTAGAFYPGLYRAVEAWGFGAETVRDPVSSGLEYARDHRRERLECPALRGHELEKHAGFALDLNGIAKGYAVDLLCDVARAHPHTASCLVEIGGELKGYGTRSDAMPFWTDVALRGDMAKPTYRVALYGWACATSGEAERCHRADDQTHSHILDPRTKVGACTDLIAASVFHKECAMADALATALVVMGSEEALRFVEEHAIACVLARRDGGDDLLSPALKAWL